MKRAAIFLCLLTAGVLVLATLYAQQSPEQTLKGLKTAPGLEATLWAAEPLFTNPTDMAIDERGRIWVTEAVNYRRSTPSQNRNLPDIRPKGDRIVILEDTNGDGRADKTTVFDQSPEIRAPLGIAVFGDHVIVSQAPNILIYTKDAADKIVKKEVFLSGWQGIDHDHGLHAVVFGPDGRFYFNNGNTGYDVIDHSGHRIQSSGYESRDPNFGPGMYWMGAAMSVNPDGTDLRVLSQNFRNPYEIALDSFGAMFQTDNDDDGNAWTRLNYLMEGGNYGYRGPLGRTWQTDDGAHFHNELPGVVPNIERLGAGSPCGLLVYEGKLLPERFRGHPMHAEAGKRIIRSYQLSNDGAGYSAKIEDMLYGADTWFRPSDVAVAPDGAVYVADWYDPSVGGHGMGDREGSHGRIYRLAPPKHKSIVPKVDLDSAEGLTEAFRSPAQSVQYLAFQKLKSQGQGARPLLQKMWKQPDPVLRARALWLLGGLGPAEVQEALRDADPRFRILGLRVARLYGSEIVEVSKPLLHDPSPQVRREIALLLQDPSRMIPAYTVGEQIPATVTLLDSLIELARQYDGKDRWYLEAIGIASRGREDAMYERLGAAFPGKADPRLAQLLWELRPPAALPALVATVKDRAASLTERQQALDILGVMAQPEAAQAVEAVILADGTPPELLQKAISRYRHQLFSLWMDSRNSPALASVMKKLFSTPEAQSGAVQLADALNDPKYTPDLLALAGSAKVADEVRAAALDTVARTRNPQFVAEYLKLSQTGPTALRAAAVRALAASAAPDLEPRLKTILLSNAPNEVRSEALRAMARSFQGITMVLDLAEKGELPSELKNLATSIFSGGGGRGGRGGAPANPAADALRVRAAKLFPPPSSKNKGVIPNLRQMEKDYRPDVAAGKKIFNAEDGPKCAGCHSLGGAKKVGPDLSAIGSKMGKQALLDAIMTPSAAIAPEYYVWILQTRSRGEFIGVLTEDTADRVVVKTDAKEEVRLKPSEITSRRQSKLSMMPEDLMTTMTTQQLADVLEFLTTLKDDKMAAKR